MSSASGIKDPEAGQAKFRRLANYRTTQALDVIRRVQNTSRYPHKPEQAKRIVDTLNNAVKQVEQSFTSPGKKGGSKFEVGE